MDSNNSVIDLEKQDIDKRILKPYPPADDDCCGGGACCPCVWDHYYAQMKRWNEQRAQQIEQD